MSVSLLTIDFEILVAIVLVVWGLFFPKKSVIFLLSVLYIYSVENFFWSSLSFVSVVVLSFFHTLLQERRTIFTYLLVGSLLWNKSDLPWRARLSFQKTFFYFDNLCRWVGIQVTSMMPFSNMSLEYKFDDLFSPSYVDEQVSIFAFFSVILCHSCF